MYNFPKVFSVDPLDIARIPEFQTSLIAPVVLLLKGFCLHNYVLPLVFALH